MNNVKLIAASSLLLSLLILPQVSFASYSDNRGCGNSGITSGTVSDNSDYALHAETAAILDKRYKEVTSVTWWGEKANHGVFTIRFYKEQNGGGPAESASPAKTYTCNELPSHNNTYACFAGNTENTTTSTSRPDKKSSIYTRYHAVLHPVANISDDTYYLSIQANSEDSMWSWETHYHDGCKDRKGNNRFCKDNRFYRDSRFIPKGQPNAPPMWQKTIGRFECFALGGNYN